MPTVPPPSGAPHARGSVLHGFRAALVDLWGRQALEEVGQRLPMATRMATIDALVLPFEWVALGHVVAWHEALWNGPLGADEERLTRLIARSIELGFGRFQSAFFTNATPERLVARAQELWRYQHTHGEVSVALDERSAAVTLRDHPYVGHPASRRVTAESYRRIVTASLGRPVRAAWGMQGRASIPPGSAGGSFASPGAVDAPSLVVHLSW
jgi:hypothetical protein